MYPAGSLLMGDPKSGGHRGRGRGRPSTPLSAVYSSSLPHHVAGPACHGTRHGPQNLTSAYRGTIISHYFYLHFDTIISLIFLQMSWLLFFIISLSQKGLLFHLWHFYYFTYFYQHKLLHYLYINLLLLFFFSKPIILIISFCQNPSLLLQLYLLLHCYLRYICVWPL